MAKFNSAWLIHKRQFRSLTGVEADKELPEPRHAPFSILRPHTEPRGCIHRGPSASYNYGHYSACREQSRCSRHARDTGDEDG